MDENTKIGKILENSKRVKTVMENLIEKTNLNEVLLRDITDSIKTLVFVVEEKDGRGQRLIYTPREWKDSIDQILSQMIEVPKAVEKLAIAQQSMVSLVQGLTEDSRKEEVERTKIQGVVIGIDKRAEELQKGVVVADCRACPLGNDTNDMEMLRKMGNQILEVQKSYIKDIHDFVMKWKNLPIISIIGAGLTGGVLLVLEIFKWWARKP